MCRIIVGLILILPTALACVFGQITTAAAVDSPRIVLKLPDNIASDTVAIWYFLMAQRGKTGPVKPQRNVRQYIITAAIQANLRDLQPFKSIRRDASSRCMTSR